MSNMSKVSTVGEPVYENGLTAGICGIVYKKEVSDQILDIQKGYLEKVKPMLLDAAGRGEVMLSPGGWHYGFLFGAYAGFYAGNKLHEKMDAMKRPYRKEVKDVIMRSRESCYTYDWTMSDYEKGISPVYIHYTNPFDEEGRGTCRPEVKQRLRYIETPKIHEDRGLQYLPFDSNLSDKISNMEVDVRTYDSFYICSYDAAKQLAADLYARRKAADKEAS